LEEKFISSLLTSFSISFGVVIGGTLFGSMSAFFIGESPYYALSRIAVSLKIWAIVAAIGGTFNTIENLQRGVLDGSTTHLVKQVVIIVSAMVGVKVALRCISWLIQEEIH